MSSFNATTNLGGGAFGSGNAGQSGSSIFGSGTSNNDKPAGNIFGAASNPASSSGGSGLFGNTAGLFGGGSNASPAIGSSIFGNNPSADKVTGGSSLGGGNNTPSLTSGTGNALFGGSKTAGGGIFGGSNVPTTSTSTPASGPNGGSLFGNIGAAGSTLNNTKPLSTGTNPLFGGSSLFSLPKSGESTTEKPATSNFFAQPLSGASGAPATGSTTSAGGGLFNFPPKPADAPTTSSAGVANPSVANISSTSSGGLFGSGGLFAKPATTSTPSAAAAGNTASEKKGASGSSNALGGGLFGSSGTAKKDENKKDGTPAAPSTFTLFGSSGKPDEKQSAFAAPKTGEKKDALAIASTSVAIAPPSMLRGKTLEEVVNRWTSDLETYIREFDKFGAEVAVWDRALIENGNNIAALYSHVLAAEQQQNEINEALDHIEQQQKDLASTLDAYEKVSHEIPGMQGGTMRSLDTGPADNERDRNYMLATDLHTHMDDLSGSMTQLIEAVNTLSVSSKLDDSSNDPMSQITRILSSHLESLQWIDTAVREVENKASEVDKRIKESGHSLSGSGLKPRVFGLNR